MDVVRPFCEVVMSEDTSGPITGLAIGALNKFLICDLISKCVCIYIYIFPVTPQKPWFNQFVAYMHFVPCVFKRFYLGDPWCSIHVSRAAARVTVTWTVAGAFLVSTLCVC